MTSAEAERAARDAWSRLGHHDEPTRVELLKRGRGDTLVLRLHGSSAPVIAKRASRETAQVEALVYENILPRLRLATPRYYGSATGDAEHVRWLFVEETQGRRYRPDRAEHRAAAARWLADLHRCTAGRPQLAELPRRDPSYYRGLLDSLAKTLRLRLGSPALVSPSDAFRAVLGCCQRLDARWSELDRACAGVPDAVVHGDLVTHNARILEREEGLVFLPFDWEKAGWGVAAEDVSGIDRDEYWRALGGRRCGLERSALDRIAEAGRIFRCLVFLDWALGAEEPGELRQEAERIELCRSWLDRLLEREAWKTS